MIVKIPGIRIEQTKNGQHEEFMTDVLEQAKVSPGIVTYLPAQLADFKAAAEHEQQCNLHQAKSPLTQQIRDKDRERDSALGKLRAALWAATGNPDPDVASAAKYLWDYSGIEKVSGSEQYDEQTGKVTTLLTRLLDEQPERTEQATVKPYVMQLKRLNDQMCQLLIQRDAAQGAKGPSQIAAARTESDRLYRELVYAVNCLSFTYSIHKLVDQPQENPFTNFTDFMLGLIARYNREILNRKPGESEETEDVEEEETTTDGDQTTTETEETEETLTK